MINISITPSDLIILILCIINACLFGYFIHMSITTNTYITTKSIEDDLYKNTNNFISKTINTTNEHLKDLSNKIKKDNTTENK